MIALLAFGAAQAWAPNGTYAFDKAKYHVTESADTDFPMHDIHVLNGTLHPKGGDISLHSANGTFPDTRIHFGPEDNQTKYLVHQRNISTMLAGKLFKGRAILIDSPKAEVHMLEQMIWYVPGIRNSRLPYPTVAGFLIIGPNPGPPTPAPTPAPPTSWVPSDECAKEGFPCTAGASICCADPASKGKGTGACYKVARCSDIRDGP